MDLDDLYIDSKMFRLGLRDVRKSFSVIKTWVLHWEGLRIGVRATKNELTIYGLCAREVGVACLETPPSEVKF